MKRIVSIALILVLLAGSVAAQDFRPIRRGIEYAELTRGSSAEPVKVFLLRLDLKKVRLDVVHANDTALGVETTSSIARRKGALAAVNAGFFRLDRSPFAGEASGVLKIDGRLLSESYADRGAIGILNRRTKTEVAFGRLNAIASTGFFPGQEFDGINRERKNDEVIVYTPEFGRTPASGDTLTEIIFHDCENRCRNSEIVETRGGTLIPTNGYVASVKAGAKPDFIERLRESLRQKAGLSVWEHYDLPQIPEPSRRKLREFFEDAEDIVAGVPILISNGEISVSWEAEKASRAFAETRHPRTAVAKLRNGRLLLVAVDGRQPGRSVGMSLAELAGLLSELGAVEALNLDGGGSTAMYVDGKTVNVPSDKEGERKVSDAIVVTLRK